MVKHASGLFMQIIGGNMFSMFTEGNFLGIIVLGAGFGVGEHTYLYSSILN